jgi:hypothetical protein
MDISALLPTFVTAVRRLHDLLLPVCLVLAFAGLVYKIVSLWRERSLTSLFPYLVKVLVAFSLLGLMASWGQSLSEMVGDLNQQLGLNQTNVLNDYAQALAEKFQVSINTTGQPAQQQSQQDQQNNPLSGFLNWAGGVAANVGSFFHTIASGSEGIGAAIMGIFVLIWSLLGMVAMWLVSIVQQILFLVCIAISPIFLGCLLIPPLGHLAARFFTNFVAVCLWPLGWGIANLITKALIDLAINPNNHGDLAAFNFFGGGLVWWIALGFWALFSSIAAPWLVTKALSAGESPMLALFGGATSAAVVVSQTGMTVGAAALGPATGGGSVAAGGIAASTLAPTRSFASRPGSNGAGAESAKRV